MGYSNGPYSKPCLNDCVQLVFVLKFLVLFAVYKGIISRYNSRKQDYKNYLSRTSIELIKIQHRTDQTCFSLAAHCKILKTKKKNLKAVGKPNACAAYAAHDMAAEK